MKGIIKERQGHNTIRKEEKEAKRPMRLLYHEKLQQKRTGAKERKVRKI